MKLRNKKTGEHGDYLISTEGDLVKVRNYYNDDEFYLYDSLAEFNEDWEDYKPADPLIKDEKIRKAVRAWADVQGIKEVKYIEGIASSDFHFMFEYGSRGTNRGIIHWGRGALTTCLEDGKTYTIAELCGDEEK